MYRILFAISDGNMHEQRKTRSGSIIESTRSVDVTHEMKKTPNGWKTIKYIN